MTNTEIPAQAALLTEAQVSVLVQIPARTLRRMVSSGRFPRPIRIGPNPEAQQSPRRWVRSEIDSWLAKLMEQRS